MREIKFRVWDNVDYMSAPFTLQDVQLKKIEFTSDCPVMQYTGLKDKNGIEIFEGDIVKWDDGSRGKYWRVAEVFYDNDAMFSFRILYGINSDIEIGYVFGGNFMYRSNGILEVIGNKFSNPELLNQK